MIFLANAMQTCGYVLPGGFAADPIALNLWLTQNEGYLTTSKLRPWDLNQRVLPKLNFDKARIGYLNESEIVEAWDRKGMQIMIYANVGRGKLGTPDMYLTGFTSTHYLGLPLSSESPSPLSLPRGTIPLKYWGLLPLNGCKGKRVQVGTGWLH